MTQPMIASENLILVVATLIVVNRGFASTGLRLQRHAYVAVQALNFATVVVLFVARIPELPPKADFAIRVFLMLFVAWHMVHNNQRRIEALRRRDEDEAELAERAEERPRRLAAAQAADAAEAARQGEAGVPSELDEEGDATDAR